MSNLLCLCILIPGKFSFACFRFCPTSTGVQTMSCNTVISWSFKAGAMEQTSNTCCSGFMNTVCVHFMHISNSKWKNVNTSNVDQANFKSDPSIWSYNSKTTATFKLDILYKVKTSQQFPPAPGLNNKKCGLHENSSNYPQLGLSIKRGSVHQEKISPLMTREIDLDTSAQINASSMTVFILHCWKVTVLKKFHMGTDKVFWLID